MAKVAPFPIRDTSVTHVVIEIFGGDNNLTGYVREDLQEMMAGNRGNFALLALVDTAREGGQVLELSPRTGERVIESLGEIDTGDPEVLAQFLARALVSYPNAKKAIGFWDHGSGVFDEHDPNETFVKRLLDAPPRWRRGRSVPARRLFIPRSALLANSNLRAMLHDDTNGGVLTNREAYHVLKAAFSRAGVNSKVELIFSDTCLNGMVEVLEQFREFAHVIVASEDLEPGDGWDYTEWFQRMSEQPPTDGLTWGRQAVQAFGAGYAHRPDQHPCTLAAFKADNRIVDGFRELIRAVDANPREGFHWMRNATASAQSFARHDTFDIRDFALHLQKTVSAAAVKTACTSLIAAIDEARVESVALGNAVRDSHGLAFWFPTTRHSFESVASTYTGLRFDETVRWVDYLRKHYHAS
ncbi:clostripain-related cysteine peptidase [Myxococcus sp. RHSTA-1-4]|uniref:clostripain-related cysteine peptidase n=1 Tax=Myxococcus sp. RHSTA-1-4 TaxID=2874601 RepID=UPI001CBEB0E8|nr:clostripain-related cysteine peptidase [Myxococcus sp. RHSTA-1-4]MBZ4420195.1 hypothetical protein [Myxococcus sp. RHSTA-1-4]